MRHVCTLPQTLDLAHEMCEKAKTIGDPKNQDILNRLCELLERRLAKKKEKDTGGTGKRNAGLVRVISIRARTHDARTRATHVPTRMMTWTLTDHTIGPLSLLGCGYTGGAALMAGGRVHESGPFEARQVLEERQGPHVQGTEGACPAPPSVWANAWVGNRISKCHATMCMGTLGIGTHMHTCMIAQN